MKGCVNVINALIYSIVCELDDQGLDSADMTKVYARFVAGEYDIVKEQLNFGALATDIISAIQGDKL